MDVNHNEKIVSYLPLSHIAASMFDMFCHFYHGGTVYFAQQDALHGRLVKTLADVKPTIFLGVPSYISPFAKRNRMGRYLDPNTGLPYTTQKLSFST